MATGQTGENEGQGDSSDLKRKLAWRMAVAGLMILGLLAGLAVSGVAAVLGFAIDLAANAVDCIFCIRLLHHIEFAEHRLAILREFHRVSRDTVIRI